MRRETDPEPGPGSRIADDGRRPVGEPSSEELRALVEEQAAVRRVTTLVARPGPADRLFAAVCQETAGLLDAPVTTLVQYGPGGAATVVADGGPGAAVLADRSRAGDGVVLPGRLQTPIVVDGREWGVLIAVWAKPERIPPGAERRLARFADLAAIAVANAESRRELVASRARIVAAADDARRRLERDLHDGTQQRLVSAALDLRAAEAAVPGEMVELKAQLARAATSLAGAVTDLQEIARGIHPAVLSHGGLRPALKALARRAPVLVHREIALEGRLPDPVEVALYYVASEALTNVGKHAAASEVWIDLRIEGSSVVLSVRDDGVGGATPAGGSGLVGLRDRMEAFGGWFRIESPPGGGTTLTAGIPLTLTAEIPLEKAAG
jgi:signal transduction histidine kinase